MEPAFYRGDLLFLMNPRTAPYVVGDITVYKIPGADIPIVHRVIETHAVWVIHILLIDNMTYKLEHWTEDHCLPTSHY